MLASLHVSLILFNKAFVADNVVAIYDGCMDIVLDIDLSHRYECVILTS